MTDVTVIKRIVTDYYEQFYANILDNFEEKENSLKDTNYKN